MRFSTTAILCLASVHAQANIIQYFTGISYNNPAELFQVKHNDLLLGGTLIDPLGRFTGQGLNFNTFKLHVQAFYPMVV